MACVFAEEKDNINPETGCLCHYVRSDTELTKLHAHQYYEFFLVIKGTARHTVNGKVQLLGEGALLFVRDFDEHGYSCAEGEYFEFINFAFTKKMFDSLFEYLGEEMDKQRFLKPDMPPCVFLLPGEKEKLFFSLTELNQSTEAAEVKLKAKQILMNIFLKYFYLHGERKNDIPLWLEMTYEKMKIPKNFIAGTERIFEIAGKSREHTSRMFKKYYGQTPSDFVSQMRLNMAVNLLLTSNISVTDICFECGFENLSWFYKCFYKKFEKTPVLYRKENSSFY